MLITILFYVVLAGLLLWALSRFWLRGKSHELFDVPEPELTAKLGGPSQAHAGIVETIGSMFQPGENLSGKQALLTLRAKMNEMGEDVAFEGSITPAEVGSVPGEWVTSANADPDVRLLYIHGGGFQAGSPLSHRAITTELASRLSASVLAIDYRLMPEHPRMASIEDCQTAYQWMLENGPHGAAAAERVIVAGDSAGGNLTLMLGIWSRNQRIRKPDALVALSPLTDMTFTSPSLARNADSDPMLGPLLGKVVRRTPNWLLVLGTALQNRMLPSNALVSPLHATLEDLPPTLLHASSAEMLYSDSVRFYNKAKASGSPVEMGVWPHMVHVWHVFVGELPEAGEAFDHIEAFLA